jgi:hypothetical protein
VSSTMQFLTHRCSNPQSPSTPPNVSSVLSPAIVAYLGQQLVSTSHSKDVVNFFYFSLGYDDTKDRLLLERGDKNIHLPTILINTLCLGGMTRQQATLTASMMLEDAHQIENNRTKANSQAASPVKVPASKSIVTSEKTTTSLSSSNFENREQFDLEELLGLC